MSGTDDAPAQDRGGIVAQLKSFNTVFWICNAMEMLERLAYYGLRTVLPVYMVLAVENGGPEFSQIQKGVIYAWWAAAQSAIPIVSGGYADKYGYKKTVSVAIAIKIVGYVIMAYAIEIASALTGGSSANNPGHEAVYSVFIVGALALASGTAVFKPGIQGLLAMQMNDENGSLGWSVFYQLVNVGGFLGPILAGAMRLMEWRYVFISCAIIVALNYVLLLTFKEPEAEAARQGGTEKVRKTLGIGTLLIAGSMVALSGLVQRLALQVTTLSDQALGAVLGLLVVALLPIGLLFFVPSLGALIAANSERAWSRVALLITALAVLLVPALGFAGVVTWATALMIGAGVLALNFLGVFAFDEPTEVGQLSEFQEAFVVLWDSVLGICEPRLMGFLVVFSGFWAMFYQLFDLLPNYITDWVDGRAVAQTLVAPFMDLPAKWNGHLPQEYMININAGMCMLFAFVIGFYMGKMRSMLAMIAGMAVASAAIYGLGLTTNGWVILLVIACFSIGELMASPTKMRYFSGLAPKGKKGLYLGYINATVGIGWALGSIIAGKMYEEGGDKVVLARRYLIQELKQDGGAIAALKKSEVIPMLADQVGKDVDGVRELLFGFYDPSFVWTHFTMIGVASMVGLIIFDRVTEAKMSFRNESMAILVLTAGLASWTYGLQPGLVFGGSIAVYLAFRHWAPDLLPGDADESDPSDPCDDDGKEPEAA